MSIALVALGARVRAEDPALALVATRTGLEVVDPRFVIASIDATLEPGDGLVFRVETSGARAHAAGIELGFDSGALVRIPVELARAGWSTERIALDAHAGRRLVHVAVFQDAPAQGRSHVLFDDVAIERAGGERVVLLDPTPKHAARDGRARAALALVDGGVAPGERPRPLPGSVRDPWAALDLSTLRKRLARASSGSARVFGLPRGRVYAGDGVPLYFANDGEPETVPARGQRISIEPLDGGAFYVLHLALASADGGGFDTLWKLVGADGETRDVRVAMPARSDGGEWVLDPEQGFADDGCVVLEVPAASAFPVVAIEVPNDERLELAAVTVLWTKRAIEDARFRRALFQRERSSKPLAQYLRALRIDGVFVELGDEEEHERELFRRLVAGDLEGFDRLLGERLVALKPRGRAWRGARTTFVPSVPEIDAALGVAEWESAVLERERQRIDVLRRFDKLRMDAPDGRTLDLLATRAPELWRALHELAREERIVPGPVGWMHGDLGLVGEAALARQLRFGAEEFSRMFEATGTTAWAPNDLAWFRQLPQLAASAGCSRLVAAPLDALASPRPSLCDLEGPDRTAIELVSPSAMRSEGRFDALLPLERLAGALEAAGARIGARELCVPLVSAAADEAILRENRRRARDLCLAEIGPKARVATLPEYVADAKQAPGFALPRWRANKEGPRAPELSARSDELHAWTRKAEHRLVAFGVAAALATPDGYAHSRPLERLLWERVLANHAAAEAGASSRGRIDDAREVALAAEALADEALDVLARAADTRGLGKPVFVFNTLALARSAPVVVEDGDFDVWGPNDRVVPSQRTAEGKRVFEAELPSAGHAVYRLVPRAIATGMEAAVTSRARVEERTLSNAHLACVLDERTGAVTSLRQRVDGALGIETLRSGARLEIVDDRGTVTELPASTIEVLEQGPVRARTRSLHTMGDVRVVQELVLRAGSTHVEATTRVEGRLEGALRVAFEVVKPRDAAQRSVPFGFGTVRSQDGELSRAGLSGWVSQGDGFGVALASEEAAACGTLGARVWLWLADAQSDARQRTVHWAFVPFVGSEQDARLMTFGQEVAQPARARSTTAHPGVRPARHSYFGVARLSGAGGIERGADARVVVTEFGLAADGDGWSMRFFDGAGKSSEVELEFDRPIFGVDRVDVLGRTLATPKRQPRAVRVRLDPWCIEAFEGSWKP